MIHTHVELGDGAFDIDACHVRSVLHQLHKHMQLMRAHFHLLQHLQTCTVLDHVGVLHA